MKCTDCQFNLLCHAGRLDSWSKDQQNIVLLCPKCNRLCVGQHESLYIFGCEQRRLGDDALAFIEKKIADKEFTTLSSLPVPDMGPGLVGKLTLAYCFDCLDALPPNKRKLTVKYLDENRETTFAEESVRGQMSDAIEADAGFNNPEEEEP